jgi:hypothetical protein
MATIIKIKRSAGTTAPSALRNGELAYTYGTGVQGGFGDRLFVGQGTETGTPPEAANIDVIGGVYFTDMLSHVHGTVTASTALIVDSNKKLDELSVDNLKLDGNVVSSTSTDGHIYLTPAGSGRIVASNLYIGTDSIQEYVEDIANSSITAGEGIDVTYHDVNGTITIDGEDATTANKGIASFDSTDFSVSAGAVSLVSLSNAHLAASTVSYGGVQLSLGGTDATPAFDLSDATAYPGDSSLVTVGTLNGLTIAANKTISMGSNRVTNVTDPSGAQDAATKAYVDATVNGLDVKDSVRIATTAALPAATYNNSAGTLTANASGALTIDSVATAVSNRILVKNQSAAAQNGIYEVTTIGSGSASFVLTRTADGNTGAELSGGSFFFVEEGTLNQDNGYVATHNGAPTLGTDSIVFAQFSGAGQISAGDALSKTGNTIDVEVDNSSIEIVSDALNVKALGITNGMLFGSIDLTSKVTGTLPVTEGGLGLASPTANRLLIGAGTSAMSVLGAGTAGQVMVSDGTNAPAFADIDGGTF